MRAIDWTRNPRLPRCVAGLLDALRLPGGGAPLADCSPAEWKSALYYCDRHQMALLVRHVCGARLPEAVRGRLDRDYARNRERLRRVRQVYREAADALAARGIECAVLKGFAGAGAYFPDPDARVQYDLDLYCPAAPYRARDALVAAGYESVDSVETSTTHLPPLVRKTGWQWRGDFFDPEIPVSIELHDRLWNDRFEAIPAPGLEAFWERRVRLPEGCLALDPVDALGHKALHVLGHVLHGEVRAAHLYELAYFLDAHAGDGEFWRRWHDLHPAGLRALELLAFRLAYAWFECRLHPSVVEESENLPAAVARWFEVCAASPAEALFRPNKDELWLHFLLLRTARDKAALLRRRLLPARLPGPLDSVFLPQRDLTWRVRLRKRVQFARYALGRAVFHLRAVAPTLATMAGMLRR